MPSASAILATGPMSPHRDAAASMRR